MPRRTTTRTVTSSATPQASALPQQVETPYDSNIYQLRRHWKWAAFSQFFFTFSPLLQSAMADVTLTDVENDLVHSTNRVLPRIMQRLLITLTQDRKITVESWQNTLRRQYQRRDPEASPIGLPTRSQHYAVESSRASTAPPVTLSDLPDQESFHENELLQCDQSNPDPTSDIPSLPDASEDNPDHTSVAKIEEDDVSSETLEAPEKQVDWLDLSMLAKLDSLYALAEWQFQNPHRVRQQMKTDDEQATWRIEPVGYDAKRNAYWLIGGDRLWIQREPPKLNLKRKRKPGGNSRAIAKEKLQLPSMKRQRTDLDSSNIGSSSVLWSTRSKAQSKPSPGSREGRAAKTRANQKLDAQAKDLAEFRRQMTSSRTRVAPVTPRKPSGIRVSARLRGTVVEDDEWQEIPDEWLANNNTHETSAKDSPSGFTLASKKRLKTGLESDDSELTELSGCEDDATGAECDSEETPAVDMEEANQKVEKDIDVEAEGQQNSDAKFVDPSITSLLPDDFVEWETICVTLQEWESIEQQFERATHYAEKALHKVLSQSIVPMVTAELREVEKKKRMEDAVVHRKRSSRIAMKEIEKEEERAAIRKRAEEEEKMSRARRLEARQQKEQAERLRRENAREQRRKERDLQEQQSAETQDAEIRFDTSANTAQEGTSQGPFPVGQGKAPVAQGNVWINGTGSGSRSPVENWELDCEVCGRKGINQDDGVPLLCCGVCGKWQHIICHDKQDAMSGHPKRNWDIEDFICRQCHLMASKNSSPSSSTGFISHGVNGKRGQVPSTPTYYGQTPNHPRTHPKNDYYRSSPSNARYSYDQPDVPKTAVQSYSPQAPSSGVTFAHYQPQQGGFSTSRPTYSVEDTNSPQHARYTVGPHAVAATGISSYPSPFHTQIAHSPTHIHEQWTSYPRINNSHPTNNTNGSPLRSQGVQPYYNGHGHTSYSHMRGTTSPVVMRQYTELQHVPSYQHTE